MQIHTHGDIKTGLINITFSFDLQDYSACEKLFIAAGEAINRPTIGDVQKFMSLFCEILGVLKNTIVGQIRYVPDKKSPND